MSMIELKKFEAARNKRVGKAVEAARLVLVYEFNQVDAAKQFDVSQQSVSIAVWDIKNRVARIDNALNVLKTANLTTDIDNAFLEALGALND